MEYHEFQLTPLLSDYIQTIWAMESESEQDGYPRSQIMPDGIVEIIFHYEVPMYTYQGDTKFLQPESFAISMMRKFVEIESTGKTGFISARFFPWGAHHFFDEPVRNFLDQTIDSYHLWGEHPKAVLAALKSCSTLEGRFKIVESFLIARLNEYKKEGNSIDDAIKLVRQAKGQSNIEQICEQTGLSKKQLERKFLSTVGTTPKIFSRICRFLNLCQHLENYKGKTFAELTHDCGYYDQSHFIKEFKEFSGYTPKEFFTKENVYFTEV